MLRQLFQNVLRPPAAITAATRRRLSGAGSAHVMNGLENKQIEENILRETKISRQHLTPEIPLHLITQECRLFHEPQLYEEGKVFKNDPFWAFYWPGGQALSKYVMENPEMVNGKSVLDVGSGCGATSIAAIMNKAKYAVANDIDDAAKTDMVKSFQKSVPTYTYIKTSISYKQQR